MQNSPLTPRIAVRKDGVLSHACAGVQGARHNLSCVMAGLVPAIHVFLFLFEDVDARVKRGHDG